MAQLHSYKVEHACLTDNSPSLFAEKKYLEFVENYHSASPVKATTVLEGHIQKFSGLHHNILSLQGQVLSQAGAGKDVDELKRVAGIVHEMICWLQDIWCVAIEGFDSLLLSYKNTALLYQA